jgi:hypothetical protein
MICRRLGANEAAKTQSTDFSGFPAISGVFQSAYSHSSKKKNEKKNDHDSFYPP